MAGVFDRLRGLLPGKGGRKASFVASSRKHEADPGQPPREGEDGGSSMNVVDMGALQDPASETLTGYCTISENLEPCEWVLSKPKGDPKPATRVVF